MMSSVAEDDKCFCLISFLTVDVMSFWSFGRVGVATGLYELVLESCLSASRM